MSMSTHVETSQIFDGGYKITQKLEMMDGNKLQLVRMRRWASCLTNLSPPIKGQENEALAWRKMLYWDENSYRLNQCWRVLMIYLFKAGISSCASQREQ